MLRGWKKGTKNWKIRKNSQDESIRLVEDLTVANARNTHPVSFKRHAVITIPGKSIDTRADAIVCKEYAIKVLGKDKSFFETHVLHHDLDGTRMYVDKKLHTSKQHLGYGYQQLQKTRKDLGLI